MKQHPPILLLCLFGLLLASCQSDSGTPSGKNSQVPLPELTSKQACQTLLVIMEDRSGSTDDHRKFSEQDYQAVFEHFARGSSGTVALRVIGNVALEERDFFRLAFDPPFDLLQVPEDGTLSEKGLVVSQNKRIAVINDSLRKVNVNRIPPLMNIVQDKVLAYKPAGKDFTNIAEALTHLNALVNEATFRNYKEVMVVLASDGVHNASKEKIRGLLAPRRPISLFLIGWKDESVFEGISNIQRFESKDGFLNWWRNYRCQ